VATVLAWWPKRKWSTCSASSYGTDTDDRDNVRVEEGSAEEIDGGTVSHCRGLQRNQQRHGALAAFAFMIFICCALLALRPSAPSSGDEQRKVDLVCHRLSVLFAYAAALMIYQLGCCLPGRASAWARRRHWRAGGAGLPAGAEEPL
jgi:hypothetical protein